MWGLSVICRLCNGTGTKLSQQVIYGRSYITAGPCRHDGEQQQLWDEREDNDGRAQATQTETTS